MTGVKRPIISISATVVAIVAIFGATCKFSFAESNTKRPSKGTVLFGAEQRPAVPVRKELEAFKSVFADVAEKVVPTVVQVIPTKIDTVVFSNNPFYQFFGEDPFSGQDPFGMFFGRPGQRQRRPEPPVQKQQRRQEGLGSGVIVSKDGYILTNYHVVAGADEIEVKTKDGRSFEAEVIGSDTLTDVAVIRIKEKVKDLPVAYLGDSDKLRPGDWVLAVGNPFSLTSTVTSGIVSAMGRSEMGNAQSYQNFIQTDAAINPGNSGGALVNIDGELIGINTMIYTRSGGYMGIGFAIPINMARWVMEDLIYVGKVSRGWLGVTIQDINSTTREALGIAGNVQGVLIGDVLKGQPADKAGIRRGDVVLSIGGKGVTTTNELRNTVASLNPGKEVPVSILRSGKEITVKVKLTERDEAEVAKSSSGTSAEQEGGAAESDAFEKFGITVNDLTPDLRGKYNLDKEAKGVVVVQVDPSSQAAAEGFREGDVVKEIKVRSKDERISTVTVKDFRRAVKQIKPAEPVMFLVERGGNTFFVAFRLRK